MENNDKNNIETFFLFRLIIHMKLSDKKHNKWYKMKNNKKKYLT